MSTERFDIGTGRERPPYEPRRLDCANCGASLEVKDEHSRLVVCPSCGSHLELSPTELKVLGQGPANHWDFQLEIGDSVRVERARFEVIGRLAVIEEGEPLEVTRQYLLYHPRRGSRWISEYCGHWDITRTTHVMPCGPAFGLRKSAALTTHDGNRWVAVEHGTIEIAYVDGALPWIARTGDRMDYAEFGAVDGSRAIYEVVRHGNELEFGTGRVLSVQEVRRAASKPALPGPVTAREDVAGTRRFFRGAMALVALAFLVNGACWLVARSKGHEVLRQGFAPIALTEEVLSRPFEIDRDDRIVKAVLTCNALDNEWMAVDLALVHGEDRVVHVTDADIEYYHGYDDGAWSEGSRSKSVYFEVPESGTYRLLVHAVDAPGSTSRSSQATKRLRVQLIAGALRPTFLTVTSIGMLAVLVLLGLAYHQWSTVGSDEDDED